MDLILPCPMPLNVVKRAVLMSVSVSGLYLISDMSAPVSTSSVMLVLV